MRSSYLVILMNLIAIIHSSQYILKFIDDVKKSSISRTIITCARQNLHNKEEEDLIESTGVVLAKYPPKVKLENFHNSRVPELD